MSKILTRNRNKVVTRINGKELVLSNLNKIFWPSGLTKADLIQYYAKIASYILPHLKNRPFSMNRFPDGIKGENFYQKECPEHAPEWIKTFPVPSESRGYINYVLCNDKATLVWLANMACIEMHPWLAKVDNLQCPDIAVFDLDPAPPATFEDTLEVASLVREALSHFKLKAYPKTSGATGLHLYVPLKIEYTYEDVRNAVEYVCRIVNEAYPEKTTMERLVSKRTGKVYLDYLQNGAGRTMASVYSLRPEVGATVSTPLSWEEIEKKSLKPENFNIKTILKRIEEKGDLFREMLENKQSLKLLMKYIT